MRIRIEIKKIVDEVTTPVTIYESPELETAKTRDVWDFFEAVCNFILSHSIRDWMEK